MLSKCWREEILLPFSLFPDQGQWKDLGPGVQFLGQLSDALSEPTGGQEFGLAQSGVERASGSGGADFAPFVFALFIFIQGTGHDHPIVDHEQKE